MGKLSHALIDLGFIPVLGMPEYWEGKLSGNEERLIKPRTPSTWDSNNGVIVVYDERGLPWIRTIRSFSELESRDFHILLLKHCLKQGAYVPHSNDGGKFVHEVLPRLLQA